MLLERISDGVFLTANELNFCYTNWKVSYELFLNLTNHPGQKLIVKNHKSKVESRKLKDKSWKLKVESLKLEIKSQKSTVKSKIRNQKLKVKS